MVTFAIDCIPSLVEDLPYASYVVLPDDISDGVPEPIGDYGESERALPPPPKVSRPLYDTDKTIPMRKHV